MRMNTLPAIAPVGLALAARSNEPVAPLTAAPLRDVATLTSAPTVSAPQDLGVSGTSAQAFGISANGTVVGEFDTPSGDIRAFMGTSKTGLTQLASPAGSTRDWASRVNDGGQAVRYSNLPSQNAILWTKGVPYSLGTRARGAGVSAGTRNEKRPPMGGRFSRR